VENSSPKIALPTFEQIVRLNKLLIEQPGGKFVPPENLHYADGLYWALGAINETSLYGIPLYPSLSDKASLLA